MVSRTLFIFFISLIVDGWLLMRFYGRIFFFLLTLLHLVCLYSEFHPWHSHGYSFWVVGSGFGPYNPDTDIANYNLENPILRDSASLLPLEWKAFRFIADNPGVWYFHCHILSHEAMGMALKIVVQPDLLEEPSDSVRYCTQQGLEPEDDGNLQDGDNTTAGGNPQEGDDTADKNNTTSGGSSTMRTSLFLAAAAVQLAMTLLF